MTPNPGVVIGIVKEIDDKGRIRLYFPWLPADFRSAWASVAAPLAGKERGAFFMPELEDEVLVAFAHGDFDHPYIVGFLWNGVDVPPESDPKNRVILTPGGHTLRFEDGDQKRTILQSSGGHKVAFEDGDEKKAVFQSSSGHKVVMDDTSGGKSITMQTPGNLTVVLDDNAKSISLKGGGRNITLQNGYVTIT